MQVMGLSPLDLNQGPSTCGTHPSVASLGRSRMTNMVELSTGELGHLAKTTAHVEQGVMLASFTAKRPSVEEGLAAGKALREKVRRAEHARYHASSDRQDPVAILE